MDVVVLGGYKLSCFGNGVYGRQLVVDAIYLAWSYSRNSNLYSFKEYRRVRYSKDI